MEEPQVLVQGETRDITPLAKPPNRSAPPGVAGHARGLVRLLYTHNPLYVISAGLVFWGLRISFDARGQSPETGLLMAGLTGYTLLLAVAACLLVRFGRLWDDCRTILLVVVLLFLALSVTFDEALITNSETGARYFLAGLVFALLVSEGLFWGMPLSLGTMYRVPLYLLLSLFFLYPIALSRFADVPGNPELHWRLFAFPAVAGALFLTLLPAVRRGVGYVRARPAPWPWPWYPWTLFGLLAAAACARSYVLCWSFHPEETAAGAVFRPYFLVPLLLALNVLLLEGGLAARHRGVVRTAMFAPAGLVALAVTETGGAVSDLGFLETLTATVGASPLLVTLVAVTTWYALAVPRRVPFAVVGLTLALAALAVCGRDTTGLATLRAPQPLPVLLIGLLHGWLALRWWNWGRWLAAAGCVVAAATLQWYGLLVAAWLAYQDARQMVAGLDHIAGGMVMLLLAVSVSLTKLGIPRRWLLRFAARRSYLRRTKQVWRAEPDRQLADPSAAGPTPQ